MTQANEFYENAIKEAQKEVYDFMEFAQEEPQKEVDEMKDLKNKPRILKGLNALLTVRTYMDSEDAPKNKEDLKKIVSLASNLLNEPNGRFFLNEDDIDEINSYVKSKEW